MVQSFGEHTFSIELRSRDPLSHVYLPDRGSEGIVVHGELGEINEVVFVEGATLELIGSKGSIRVDVSRDEFEEHLRRRTPDK